MQLSPIHILRFAFIEQSLLKKTLSPISTFAFSAIVILNPDRLVNLLPSTSWLPYSSLSKTIEHIYLNFLIILKNNFMVYLRIFFVFTVAFLLKNVLLVILFFCRLIDSYKLSNNIPCSSETLRASNLLCTSSNPLITSCFLNSSSL